MILSNNRLETTCKKNMHRLLVEESIASLIKKANERNTTKCSKKEVT